jgi:competence protein ComEC
MSLQENTHRKIYILLILVIILIIVNVFLLRLDLQGRNKGLTFAMLDVGQGDALFIESPTGTQILVDAGPERKILSQLSQVMSPFDRSIDAIIITNPDTDHIGGFGEILKNYKVGQVFEPGTTNDSRTYQNLESEFERKNIPKVLVKRGMRLHIGGGAVIDILFPDRDVSFWDSNEGSIVAKLTYGKTSLMLTGDSVIETERIILGEFSKEQLDSTVLKVGHHGSRTSSSNAFIEAVSPSYALISDGKDNSYGHPHQEVLDDLTQFGAEIFRTDLLGSIIMKSDGANESFSFSK